MIEGWRIKGTDVVLDLLDEWTFWAWCQGREEWFMWRLQTTTARRLAGEILSSATSTAKREKR